MYCFFRTRLSLAERRLRSRRSFSSSAGSSVDFRLLYLARFLGMHLSSSSSDGDLSGGSTGDDVARTPGSTFRCSRSGSSYSPSFNEGALSLEGGAREPSQIDGCCEASAGLQVSGGRYYGWLPRKREKKSCWMFSILAYIFSLSTEWTYCSSNGIKLCE